jgi:hypothetical protein
LKGTIFSYVRLVVASWLFVGGLAVQFWPSAAEVAREVRARERAWKGLSMSAEQRQAQDAWRDGQDARNEILLRVFGVFLGGIGFAVALHEAAYVVARFNRGRELA